MIGVNHRDDNKRVDMNIDIEKDAIRICFFTEKGEKLEGRIEETLSEVNIIKYKKGTPISEFCSEAFRERTPLIFIGAVGIAVRLIAPFVKDKLLDPPVIVIDELGTNVIPILSGHYGGGNELAVRICELMGANPIITTATDINKVFSVDVFAKEKNLEIKNRQGIAKVSTKALMGKPITISIKNYPPSEPVDVLIRGGDALIELKEKGDSLWNKGIISNDKDFENGIVVGVGCKKGKEFEELKDFLIESLEENCKTLSDILAIATIDIKQNEECLVKLSKELSVPLISFDSETLSKVEGEFTASEFVEEITGVDNVCERAALAAMGEGGFLKMKKTPKNGMTLAFASRN